MENHENDYIEYQGKNSIEKAKVERALEKKRLSLKKIADTISEKQEKARQNHHYNVQKIYENADNHFNNTKKELIDVFYSYRKKEPKNEKKDDES